MTLDSLRSPDGDRELDPETTYLSDADLKEVRDRVDWQQLFLALGLTKDERKSRPDDWWALSPLTSEETASFHVNDKGWFCFSSGQGGGPIELVQAVLHARGQTLNCYEAGRWLLENGLSSLPRGGASPANENRGEGENPGSEQPEAPKRRLRRRRSIGGLRPISTNLLREALTISEKAGFALTGLDGSRMPVGQNVQDALEATAQKRRVGRPRTEALVTGVVVLETLKTGQRVTSLVTGLETTNPPIRQNLLSQLTLQGEHPEFVRRGISAATCQYLGCGYLERANGPMKRRIVFQVRGVKEAPDGSLKPVVLSHVGRATSEEQEHEDGKWHHYLGFNSSREIFNVDKVLLDPEAAEQARQSGQVLLVEGAFDVAKLIEAGIKNVVATFGCHVSDVQAGRLQRLTEKLGIGKVLVFYDRDDAGRTGQAAALDLLRMIGLEATGFDWEQTFASARRPVIRIPETVKDPGEFSPEQLWWLRAQRRI